MSVGEICNREVVITEPGTSALEAARLMSEHHVGSIVVVEGTPPRPIGIVTDRDLVVKVMAQRREPAEPKVRELMRPRLVTLAEEAHTWEAVERMQAEGMRRLVVVDDEGALQGILAMDDLLEFFAGELSDLVKTVGRERTREAAAGTTAK
jgi:CBS domain-containing protein